MNKSGVNKNGIHWIKEGKTYTCYFLWGGIELVKIFKNVQHSFIEKLDFHSLK